jgi:hypothetical protein
MLEKASYEQYARIEEEIRAGAELDRNNLRAQTFRGRGDGGRGRPRSPKERPGSFAASPPGK